MWDTPKILRLSTNVSPNRWANRRKCVCECVDLLWSRFNKLPARRNSKLSKSTSCLFIFYSLHTTQILGLCLSVAITFWFAVLKSLWLFVLIARQLKKPLSHSRAIPLSLSLFCSSRGRSQNTKEWEKNVTKPKPMTHTLRLGLAHSLRLPLGLPAPAAAPSSLAKCPIQQLLLLLLLLYLYAKRRCRRRQLSKAKQRGEENVGRRQALH